MDIQAICAQYANGKCLRQLEVETTTSSYILAKALRAAGVTIRGRGDYPSTRKHHFFDDLFASWTPDMAYVLGLVTTDGSVQGRGTLRIYQVETALLDQVRDIFVASAPYDTCGDRAHPIPTLRLHSRRMIDDLAALGVGPNKSLTIRAPLSQMQYPNDYIRGVFDGDGHGGFFKKRAKRVLRIGFTSGSRDFLLDIAALLPVPIGGPYENRGCWSLATSTEAHAITLRDWMYANGSDLYSTRKRAKLYR